VSLLDASRTRLLQVSWEVPAQAQPQPLATKLQRLWPQVSKLELQRIRPLIILPQRQWHHLQLHSSNPAQVKQQSFCPAGPLKVQMHPLQLLPHLSPSQRHPLPYAPHQRRPSSRLQLRLLYNPFRRFRYLQSHSLPPFKLRSQSRFQPPLRRQESRQRRLQVKKRP